MARRRSAAERTELDEESGDPALVGRGEGETVLIERLERQRPTDGVRGSLEPVVADGVRDLPEQAGEQTATEHHERRDAVGRRSEEDRAEDRQRRECRDREG